MNRHSQIAVLSGLLMIFALAAVSWVPAAQNGDKVAEGFRRYDQDRDGKLTAAEFSDAGLFQRLDADGDDAITLVEARRAAAAGVLQGVQLPRPGRVTASDPPTVPSTPEPTGEIRQGPVPLKPGDQGVGRFIADVVCKDLAGREFRLSDFADRKALVLLMTGTGCPLCQKYAPTLAELERRYRDRGVAFVYVNPNDSESLDDLKQAVQRHGFQGPYVRDSEDQLIRALGARTTTEAFVLDAARTLVYRGAVDDQYGFAYALDAPRHAYLVDALEAVLIGQAPRIAATSSPGCELFLDSADSTAEPSAATYHNRVSRILQNNCVECHREGGLAPFSLETYDHVKDYAGMIRRVVDRQIMPPWFAAPDEPTTENTSGVRWANDRSLSKQDRSDLLAWIEAGAPIGNPQDAPLPRSFPEQWMIGDPDVVLQIPEPVSVKATGRMPYQYARVTTDFAEDRWVQAVELQPTDRAVVHHVLVFVHERGRGRVEIDEQSGFFAAYVPGNSYQQYPEGFAKKLPAGATLIFQLHYTPNGTATSDQTQLGLVFSDTPPEHLVRNVGIANNKIEIPPGASSHAEQASWKSSADVRVLAFMPHMHLRGKAFRFELVRPDGQRQRLLDVPRYDFNWQLEYRLADPLDVAQGSRIEVTGWFDNSAGNPANPDPTQTVRWGPQTEDEMLLGYVEYYLP